MATFSPTTRASAFARHGLGRREQDGFDAAHVFAPAQLGGQFVQLGVVEFGFRLAPCQSPYSRKVGRPVSSRAAPSATSRSQRRRMPRSDMPPRRAAGASASSSSKAVTTAPAPLARKRGAVAIRRLGAAREFAMEVDGGGGGARVGDRHLAEFVPRTVSAAQAGNQQGQRDRPAQPLRQHGIGEPEAQEFRAGMVATDMGKHMRGRSQRRSFFADRALGDAKNVGQRVGHVEAERRRDLVEDAGVDAGRAMDEPPPAAQDAAGGSGRRVAGGAKREPVAQFALALASAEQAAHGRPRRGAPGGCARARRKGRSARTQASSAARLAPARNAASTFSKVSPFGRAQAGSGRGGNRRRWGLGEAFGHERG